jgi:pyrimidine operon attenuation protein / uracil phosphoribosyltransferase
MKILNEKQIHQKIKRLAIEILEQNYNADSLTLAGINNNGLRFATLIYNALKEITAIPLDIINIRLNPANPIASNIEISVPKENLNNKIVIIVDDVANTGRTIFYAAKPLLDILPSKIEVAVLVDRKHKSFPIAVDYLGLSVATTIKEHIEVDLTNPTTYAANLT